MSDLIPPHGGLTEPISRTVPTLEAPNAAPISVSAADLSTLYRIADGGLSPLTGPMTREEYDRVLDEEVIVRGGKKYAWTIPLALPVTNEEASTLSPGGYATLTDGRGAAVGGLERLTREGHYAGAVLNPLVGETKSDDVDAATRMKTYRALIDNKALGQGDTDEELWRKVGRNFSDHVLLIGLDIKMFYAGPK